MLSRVPWAVCACVLSCFSRVQLFVTIWTVARQSPLSMGFSRQEYWSGLPCPPPGDPPDPGIEPDSYVSCIGRWVPYHEPHNRSLLVTSFCLISLSASFLISFISPAAEALPQHSRCCWRERGLSSSVPHSQDTQELTHCSPFPWERGCSWLVQPCRALIGRGSTGKILLTPSSASKSILFFFPSSSVLDSLLWKVGHPWVSAQVSTLQGLPDRGWEGLGQVPQLCWLHGLYQGLPITRCTGSETPPGPLGFWWWSPTPTEVLLFMDGWVIRCCAVFKVFFFLRFIYLAVLGHCCCSGCSARASHCTGFSCCGAQALVHSGFSSCSM